MQGKNFASYLMPTLYIIAGCNGAGKTTASNTLLPVVLNCREFVNADSIAAGLSPFDVEKYAVEAGRLMLKRMEQLIDEKSDFAIETTLSSKIYGQRINQAKGKGYKIILIFFWLSNVKLAIQRVKKRVKSGGHSIPVEVIKRRYQRGVNNFFDLYKNISDSWVVIDNSRNESTLIAEGEANKSHKIKLEQQWRHFQNQYQKSIN
jgi:predicted ABC-type ATPase